MRLHNLLPSQNSVAISYRLLSLDFWHPSKRVLFLSALTCDFSFCVLSYVPLGLPTFGTLRPSLGGAKSSAGADYKNLIDTT